MTKFLSKFLTNSLSFNFCELQDRSTFDLVFFKIFIILNFTGYKSQTLKKEVKPYFGDEEEIPHGCEFVQLPHPSGQGMNVGDPMSKSFLDMLQTGVLTSYSSTGLDDQNDTAK